MIIAELMFKKFITYHANLFFFIYIKMLNLLQETPNSQNFKAIIYCYLTKLRDKCRKIIFSIICENNAESIPLHQP